MEPFAGLYTYITNQRLGVSMLIGSVCSRTPDTQ